MQVLPVKTRVMFPPKDDLFAALDESLPELLEGDVVVITSKIVAIGEGRCMPAGSQNEKKRLIEREADYLARFKEGRRSMFSIKGHTVVGSAGVDDSNSNGYWTLWPQDPFASAKTIWTHLRKKHGIAKLGVVITDSYCSPMRLGAMGIAIAFFGLHPVERHIGKPDLFGRKFKFSRSNLVDGIAAAAVVTMGETDEQQPIAVVRDAPSLRYAPYDTRHELLIPPKQDIYYPVFKRIYDQAKKRRVYSLRGSKSRR